jgi:hypothetical protein
MIDIINPDDYRCPCCMNYIYINFGCSNKHNICENCYMKLNKCPICRDDDITKYTIDVNVKRKECKNKDKGCNVNLYDFDEDHDTECIYNPLHCKFCNQDLLSDIDYIKNHYESDCVNTFKYIDFDDKSIKCRETQPRKHILSIDSVPSLINCKDEYFILMIPKSTKIDFYVFSTNNKYKLSNYKIKIFSNPKDPVFEGFINYNKLIYNSIPLKATKTLTFVIENMFIINSKTTECKIDDTTYFESHTVEGEPGAAGNWSYEDFEEITNKFINLFSKTNK